MVVLFRELSPMDRSRIRKIRERGVGSRDGKRSKKRGSGVPHWREKDLMDGKVTDSLAMILRMEHPADGKTKVGTWTNPLGWDVKQATLEVIEPSNLPEELTKLETAIKFGADTIMDLSVGGDLAKIQKEIIKNSTVPLGTVPIYETATLAQAKRKSFLDMTKDDIFDVLIEQAKRGVDFFTVHSGPSNVNLSCILKMFRQVFIITTIRNHAYNSLCSFSE